MIFLPRHHNQKFLPVLPVLPLPKHLEPLLLLVVVRLLNKEELMYLQN
jgi:hypothetical protein